MNISRNSWHFRLASWSWGHYNKNISNSLCGYFWQVVLAPFAVLLMYSAITLFVLFIVSIALYFGGLAVNAVFANLLNILPSTFIVHKAEFNYRHIISSLIIDVIFFAYVWYQEVYKPKSSNVDKEPNLALEYIKAKKQKICPILNFKD